VISKMTENIKEFDLVGAEWGGFDLEKFMLGLTTCGPINEVEFKPQAAMAATADETEPEESGHAGPGLMTKIVLAGGITLVVYAVFGLM